MRNPVLRVQFHVPDDEAKHDALMKRAAELDDENNGDHLVAYTFEQALTVVFQGDPHFLFGDAHGTRVPYLKGWTVEEVDLWKNVAEWAGDVEEED